MKISAAWLGDYVACDDLGKEKLYEIITTKVAEVDKVHLQGGSLAEARIGFLESVKPHPTKEKLKIATVAIGKEKVQVVCGAPNCEEKQFVIYLPPGSTLLSGSAEEPQTVAVRDVAGVQSCGVLVSEAELGLTNDHSGIITFPETQKLAVGAPATSIFGESDIVLEIDNKSLTHRPDLWSHFGFARELSAILGRPLKMSADRFADCSDTGRSLLAELGRGTANYSAEIDPGTKCRRFVGLEIHGVATTPSPLWMKRRLQAVGAGVRNLLVDLSNYVMHDVGQPNHVYDTALLSGRKIFVRHAKDGEQFLGLDGVQRSLMVDDVVIADGKGPVALAGVMGGQPSSVQENTSSILLESANFDPVVIRFTTKRHQIRTDASNRFEKSRSPYAVPLAVHRFVEILQKEQPKTTVVGSVFDCFPDKPKSLSVPASYSGIRGRLDPKIDDRTIEHILTSLGFKISSSGGEQLEVEVPYERATRDISIEEDLVEEVGRIYGYEEITENAPAIKSTAQPTHPMLELEYRFRDRLAGLGFSEFSHYSFMMAANAERLGYETSHAVKLLNPIDATSDLMRTTLVPGTLEMVERNARYFQDIFLFELGRAYETDATTGKGKKLAAKERRLLTMAYVSSKCEELAGRTLTPELASGAHFYSLLGVVERLLRIVSGKNFKVTALVERGRSLSAAADFSTLKAWMHPYRAAAVSIEGVSVGVIAEVHPGVSKDLPTRTIVAELDLGQCLLLTRRNDKFQQIAKFPDSFFEMSVVLPKDRHYADLESLLRSSVDAERLRNIEVLSVYTGKPLPEDEKSISVRLSFGHRERTLTSEEVTLLQNSLMGAIEKSEFSLRS